MGLVREYFLENLGNFLSFFCFFMMLQQNHSELSQPFLLTFVFFPLYAAKRVHLYVKSQNYSESHAKQKIKVFLRKFFDKTSSNSKKIDFSQAKEKYTDSTQKALLIGDIILINRDEVLQCDALLLDCENGQCYSETSFVDGASNLSKKSPLKLTTGTQFILLVFFIFYVFRNFLSFFVNFS